MGEFLDSFKSEARSLLYNKKNLLNLLILGILILALYLFITVRQQQIIKSRAIEDPIVFTGSNLVDLPGGKKGFKLNIEGTEVKAVVSLELTSPLGPPITPSQSNRLSANLTVNGVNIGSDRTYTVSAGTKLDFTMTGQASTGMILDNSLLAITSTDEITLPPCGRAVGGTPQSPWCIITEQKGINQNSVSYAGSWTPDKVGEYYVVTNLRTTESGNLGCTSAPWCNFGGTNCLLGNNAGVCNAACNTNIWTYGDCSKEGYIKLIIQ